MNTKIIELVTSGSFPCYSITDEMDQYIKKEYKQVPDNTSGKFYKVYVAGNDAKYGHYMINPITKERRGSTFLEFYGGGIVD